MTTPVIPAQLFNVILQLFRVTYADLLAGSRRHRVIDARTVICGMARELLPMHSYKDIVELISGRRDAHTTALNAARRWQRCQSDHKFLPNMTKADIDQHVRWRLGQ